MLQFSIELLADLPWQVCYNDNAFLMGHFYFTEGTMEGKTKYVVVRMKAIEREPQSLRKCLQSEGLWKRVDITEEDLDQAKRSLF